jgi:hypothetical protein
MHFQLVLIQSSLFPHFYYKPLKSFIALRFTYKRKIINYDKVKYGK